LHVGEKIYVGTPGHWELIVSKKTKIDEISQEDKDKYLNLLTQQIRRLLLINMEK